MPEASNSKGNGPTEAVPRTLLKLTTSQNLLLRRATLTGPARGALTLLPNLITLISLQRATPLLIHGLRGPFELPRGKLLILHSFLTKFVGDEARAA
jgi:hypothetical protein